MKKCGSGGKKCQPNLRNFYLVNFAEKVLVTAVNKLNFSISFDLLRVERLLDVLTASKN